MLKAQGISKNYGKKKVLENLSLNLHSHDRMLLFGPNGAGKTTLLKILVGALRADVGNLSVSPDWQSRLGWVPSEATGFFPEISGRDNLYLFACMRGASEHSIQTFLKRWQSVSDFDFLEQRFLLYSAGMRQKLNFLRGLIHAPDALFLDEPLEHIDAAGVDFFMQELKIFPGPIVVASHQREHWESRGYDIFHLGNQPC